MILQFVAGYTIWYTAGLNLGPLLFNIFLADLFFTLNNTEIANYADDTTPHAVSDNIDDLISFLEKSSKDLLKWFDDDLMKSNPDNTYKNIDGLHKFKKAIKKWKPENCLKRICRICEKYIVNIAKTPSFFYIENNA